MTRTNQTLHRLAVSLMAGYLMALALIVFWPTPVDKPAAGSIHQTISWLHLHGMPTFIGYAQIEFSANILLFVPMGIIAAVWTKNAWLGLGVGLLTSCLIELSQSLFLAARFPSALDILANTLGAGIGAGVYYFSHKRHQPVVEPVETRTVVELVETPTPVFEPGPVVEPVETRTVVELVETPAGATRS